MKKLLPFIAGMLCVTIAGGIWLLVRAEDEKKPAERFYEMRTYIAPPGKLDALNARFRNHTCKLFQKHGMTLIGFWTPVNEPAASNTLIYIVSHPSKAARDAAWKAFRADPDWIKAKADSETNGSLTEKVETLELKPTDYSLLK